MTRLMRPGETYVVPNISGLTFNTGNAGALSLSQGDMIIPKLGEIGEIINAKPLNIKTFSKPIFKMIKRIIINYNFLSDLRNDLEEPAFKKYPILKKIKAFMEDLDKVLFVNMTGSGSTIVGYFITKIYKDYQK